MMSAWKNEPLTVERIFGRGEKFKAGEWGPAHWLEDGWPIGDGLLQHTATSPWGLRRAR